nr:hypothetical protein [Tanacetum cinerariifolium]
MKMNTASSSGSRTLPSNTITNPKEDLKGITTRSGNAYKGPTIPTTSSPPPKVVERETDWRRVLTMTSSLEELVSPLRNSMIISLIPVLILEVLIWIGSVLILIKPWWSEIIFRTIAKQITVTLRLVRITTLIGSNSIYALSLANSGWTIIISETEVKKDTVPPTNNESTKDVQPLVVQIETPNFEPVITPILEPVVALVSALKPNLKPLIPYPSRLHDQKLRDKANDQKENFFQIFKDLDFNISFADSLILMPKFGLTIKSLLTNNKKLYELARTSLNENCSAVLLKKLPEKLGDPNKFLIPSWNNLFLPGLSPTCMNLELANRSISRPVRVAEDVFIKVGAFRFLADFVVVDFDADPQVPLILGRSFLKTERALIDVYKGELTLRVGKEAVTFNLNQTSRYSASYDAMSGDILLLDEFLNNDPSSPRPPPQELKVAEPTNEKSSIDEPPVVKLKDLPPHLEYTFLEGETALIKVLKSHKQALAWQLFDSKGIDPEFCTHKILMEDDFKQAVQLQRRVNSKIHEVIKKEALKLLDAELIYPISDNPWVSPVHCVPKKGGFTIVENEENELIPTRLVMGWRVYIDYQKLNDATHKDHFPLALMD